MLMDCQHPVGTGKLANGAAACGENFVRRHVSHVRTYVPTHLYSFVHQYIVLTEP
ncbi:hypothetical protein PC123_g28858 [Phytophthora cactorum]|nr:hypothetical protein PC123_g28858 [Phytophthora cactorum]